MLCSTVWNGNPTLTLRIIPNKAGHNEYVIPKLQKRSAHYAKPKQQSEQQSEQTEQQSVQPKQQSKQTEQQPKQSKQQPKQTE